MNLGQSFSESTVRLTTFSRSDAEPATKSDLKAETVALGSAIDKLEASTKAEMAGLIAGIAGLKGDLKIIKYFFGPAIIILLLKIAFF